MTSQLVDSRPVRKKLSELVDEAQSKGDSDFAQIGNDLGQFSTSDPIEEDAAKSRLKQRGEQKRHRIILSVAIAAVLVIIFGVSLAFLSPSTSKRNTNHGGVSSRIPLTSTTSPNVPSSTTATTTRSTATTKANPAPTTSIQPPPSAPPVSLTTM